MVLYALSASGAEGKDPELGKAVALFLAANGLVASIRLFSIAFGGGPTGVLNDTDRIYLAVGAIGAFWVSFGTVIKTLAVAAPAQTNVGQEQGEDETTV